MQAAGSQLPLWSPTNPLTNVFNAFMQKVLAAWTLSDPITGHRKEQDKACYPCHMNGEDKDHPARGTQPQRVRLDLYSASLAEEEADGLGEVGLLL